VTRDPVLYLDDMLAHAQQATADEAVGRVEAKPDPPMLGGIRLRLFRPTSPCRFGARNGRYFEP
jgi:hypothetical protein